jgi:hypothetical protein
MLLARELLVLSLIGAASGFSILHIEAGSTLGVGGGSSIFITGTDIGDPFNAPVVLIGNNPNPELTLCRVQSFTSTSTRVHCIVGSTRLPARPISQWGAAYDSRLMLHVLVGGREAICDNGENIGGTGIGDCRLTFDVGGTPLVERILTPVLPAAGGLLRLKARSHDPLGAVVTSSGSSGDDDDGGTPPVATVAIRLRRGSTFAGCVLFDEESPYTTTLYHPLGEPPSPDTHRIGCLLHADPMGLAGFWDALEVTDTTSNNRGTAVVPVGARRLDLATPTMYDVETVPRVSSVSPATVPASGGAVLIVYGSGFGGSPCDVSVEAAGAKCTPLAVSRDDGAITCQMATIDGESDGEHTAAGFIGDRGVGWEWWVHGTATTSDTSSLSALTGLATFPVAADGAMLLSDFTLPPGGCWAARCAGTRLSGWFTASVSAAFSFVVHADANAELWWSANRSAISTTLLASASSDGAASQWHRGPIEAGDIHVSAPQTLAKGEHYWLELLCAATASVCSVGVRAHTSALPEALAFPTRHLTPRNETDVCSALTAEHECCAAYEASGGPCTPLAPGSPAACVSSEWLQSNLQDASAMMPCPYAAPAQPETSTFSAVWPEREQLPTNVACSTIADRARCMPSPPTPAHPTPEALPAHGPSRPCLSLLSD